MSVRLPFHGAKVLKIILGFLMVKQIHLSEKHFQVERQEFFGGYAARTHNDGTVRLVGIGEF